MTERNHTLEIPVTIEELEIVTQAAAERRMSVTDYIIGIILHGAIELERMEKADILAKPQRH